MEAYLEQAWNHANIPAELANLRPCGDFVLVRVIPEPEMQGRIVLPQGTPGRENLAPRIGEVIAVGPGDRLFPMLCRKCLHDPMGNNGPRYRIETARSFRCRDCGDPLEFMKNPQTDKTVIWRTRMHVKPGDRILYWRTYANEVVLNNELYQLIHEEQHVVAVLEEN